MKYTCTICGYVYDEEVEGVKFADLPDSWMCPWCGASKAEFEAEAVVEPSGSSEGDAGAQSDSAGVEEGSPNAFLAQEDPDDLTKLSAGQMAALLSNLARGCEKQYLAQEARAFAELAESVSRTVPAAEDATIEQLAAFLLADSSELYPAARSAAQQAGDRGALRAITWNEKVTRILSSLLARYEKEGEAFLEGTDVWICTVCGFVYVGETPPDLCPVCKVPAWKFERIDKGVAA